MKTNFNLTEGELKEKLRRLYNELLMWHMQECSYCQLVGKLGGKESIHIEKLDDIFRKLGWLK